MFKFGRSTVNEPFSIAMLVITRGYMFHTFSTRAGPRRRPCAQGLRSVRAAWREEFATELAKNKVRSPKSQESYGL